MSALLTIAVAQLACSSGQTTPSSPLQEEQRTLWQRCYPHIVGAQCKASASRRSCGDALAETYAAPATERFIWLKAHGCPASIVYPDGEPTATVGLLRVLSDNPGRIYVDGHYTGKLTPAVLKLPVGDHRIMIVLQPSNARVRHRLSIKPYKVIRIRLRGVP